MKSPKCPKCNSSNTCPIFWGLPADVDAWSKAIDAGEIALGGDVLSADDKKWHCNKCKNEWGHRND